MRIDADYEGLRITGSGVGEEIREGADQPGEIVAVTLACTVNVANIPLNPFEPEDADRLEKLWAEGVWEVAEDKSGDDAKSLRVLAQNANITY